MIIETYKGYIIQKKRNGYKFPLYLVGIYKGHEHWTTDYTYAKAYSRKTAEKHNKNIPEIMNY